MTKEEKHNEAQKKYYQKNKDKLKQWRLDNAKKIKLDNKQYRLDNKDKRKLYSLKNKEKIRLNSRTRYYNVIKTGDYRVYILPNSNYYVGYTSAETARMYKHKHDGNDTTDYMILHKCDTEKEALWFEAVYHDLGFDGKFGYKITS